MNPSINITYILTTLFAGVASFFFHELAHFVTGSLLGYEMGMTLNSAYLIEGKYSTVWHNQLVSAAGPIFTILTGFLFFYIIKKTKNVYWYPFLFFAFLFRLMAMIVSIINPNDEARISEWLGLGTWILPLLVSFTLFFLVIKTSKEQKYSVKFNLINYLLASVCIAAVVFSDQYFFK
ncbi:hypothetical protein D1816_08230 [Aquimarina sp. AD10]|uniref:Peptidase M50 domain-containing protein n=1 Tax=Aquimarina aggregata TaxID=1642818 RepID=A0A162XTZ3_9FLAO|nr:MULTISPECIES: hypothetical protein [Aquimarina]AXT60338.1 hypothetical protein D1816_08230 [Aquimarina sp. AD10]KZS38776.1 hypothetical protein AWE51_14410 [Aquimarina aggregata]RKN01228.1 hypothetical protein D7033_05250 [Aquimarina sp. AD10]